MILKEMFGESRIVGLAGDKSSGKTNNLISALKEYREKKKDVPIYAFGIPAKLDGLLKKLKIQRISSIKQLVHKENCILILDEFQKLKLNDRRNKDDRDDFVNFVYHNNVRVILSSPDIREFNSVIGGIIEKWLLKTVSIDSCINGSQLKKVVDEYKGNFKTMGAIKVPQDTILVIDDDCEKTIKCPYYKDADTKCEQMELF